MRLRTLLQGAFRGARTAGGLPAGLRFSPHLYNTMEDLERTVAAVRKYVASGV